MSMSFTEVKTLQSDAAHLLKEIEKAAMDAEWRNSFIKELFAAVPSKLFNQIAKSEEFSSAIEKANFIASGKGSFIEKAEAKANAKLLLGLVKLEVAMMELPA